MTRPSWFDLAACNDAPDGLFFASDEMNRMHPCFEENIEECRTYCDRCPVRAECLRWDFGQNNSLEVAVVAGYPAATRQFYRFGRERWRGEDEEA